MSKHPYQKGIIRSWGRDLSKRWYVEYKVFDLAKDELVWRKKYGGINRHGTIEERMSAAQNLKKAIDEMLEKGFVLGDPDTKKEEIRDMTVEEAFNFAFEIKKKQTRETNWKYYKRILKVIPAWLEEKGYRTLKIKHLSSELMFEFFDMLPDLIQKTKEEKWVKVKKGERPSNKTINNYLTSINALLRLLAKRDKKLFPDEIPTATIEFLDYETSKHSAYSRDQLLRVKESCQKLGYDNLWKYIQFIYYTLARPKEIRLMKVSHIELMQDRIFFPAGSVKGKYGDYVDIYAPLKELIIENGIMNFPPDYYVFGRGGLPGKRPFGKDYFYEQHVKVLEETRLNRLERKFDLYAYKHSGTINLYLSGVDLLDIQRQCRHKSPTQTMTYLRELDLFRKKDHLDKVSGI